MSSPEGVARKGRLSYGLHQASPRAPRAAIASEESMDEPRVLPLAHALQTSVWAYPILEVVHIAAIATLFGSLLLVELRVLGLGRAVVLPDLARLGLPVSLAAFAFAAASGSLMFVAHAGEFLANRAFQVKLALLCMAGLNAGLFHARSSLARADATAKLQAGISLALWLSILSCGRLIAYV
jgi:hypothetical protein